MTLRDETSRIVKLFKDGGQAAKNSFYNGPLSFVEYPAILSILDEGLPEGLTPNHKDKKHTSAIEVNMFDVQWHQVSVSPHVDYIQPGSFFQLIVLKTVRRINTQFDERAAFMYYGVDKKRHIDRLEIGSCITFIPYREHGLTFYGDEVIIALRSVTTCKRKR